jgi:hypothetical protein
VRIQLEVVPIEGDRYQVETSLWVITLWERKTKRKMTDLANAQGAEDLGILAYYAARESGRVVPAAIDDFLRGLAAIEIAGVDPGNPTAAAPSADN